MQDRLKSVSQSLGNWRNMMLIMGYSPDEVDAALVEEINREDEADEIVTTQRNYGMAE